VFFASQHVSGTPTETWDLYVPPLAVMGPSIYNLEAPTFAPCFHPDQPRAPPSFPA
jgi:hypothetical protein